MRTTTEQESPQSPWQRFWRQMRFFAEVIDTSEAEIQDRRIAALEAEVAHLRERNGG